MGRPVLFPTGRHVISASKRTDIPAFYSEWFLDKVRKGYCRVRNPYNPSQIKEVSLWPEDVAAVVFWTRRTKPIRPFLAELDARGLNYYFLYTVTGYPESCEPEMPPLTEALDDFLSVAEYVRPERVIWRYDPVLFSFGLDADYHRRNFRMLARQLSKGTKQVIVSFLKRYRHSTGALKKLGCVCPSPQERGVFEQEFLSVAAEEGLAMASCGKRDSFAAVPEGKCIDEKLLRELFGLELSSAKDPGQPAECRCIRSIDIGRYSTCLHRCVYCYASRSFASAARYYREHDYRASML